MDVDYYFTLLLQGADGSTAHNKEQIDPAIQIVLYEITRLSVESVLNFQNNHVIHPNEPSLSNRTVTVLLLKTSMAPFCRNTNLSRICCCLESLQTQSSHCTMALWLQMTINREVFTIAFCGPSIIITPKQRRWLVCHGQGGRRPPTKISSKCVWSFWSLMFYTPERTFCFLIVPRGQRINHC